MTNFNSINTQNIFNNLNFLSVQNNKQNNSNSAALNQTAQTTQQNIIQQQTSPNLIFDYSAFQMNNQEVLKFLQTMMNMPKTLDKFVLQAKENNNQALKVIIENLVDTKSLAEFLNKNSKDAIQKTMLVLSDALKTTNADTTQLKELLVVLNSISQNTTLQTNNALKELLLLYIPINTEAFSKNIDFELSENQQKEIKNSKISIIFESKNFSNVLFCINENNSQLIFCIFANENFPVSHFEKIIEKYSKELNLQIFFDYKKTITQKKSDTQNFKIFSDGSIPLNLLLFSHFAIKVFFEMDNNFNLD